MRFKDKQEFESEQNVNEEIILAFLFLLIIAHLSPVPAPLCGLVLVGLR